MSKIASDKIKKALKIEAWPRGARLVPGCHRGSGMPVYRCIGCDYWRGFGCKASYEEAHKHLPFATLDTPRGQDYVYCAHPDYQEQKLEQLSQEDLEEQSAAAWESFYEGMCSRALGAAEESDEAALQESAEKYSLLQKMPRPVGDGAWRWMVGCTSAHACPACHRWPLQQPDLGCGECPLGIPGCCAGLWYELRQAEIIRDWPEVQRYAQKIEAFIRGKLDELKEAEEAEKAKEAEKENRLFRILCARALQRHGEGFPASEEEIAAFNESLEISAEEREEFSRLLDWILGMDDPSTKREEEA